MAPKAQKISRPNDRGAIGRQGEELAADFLSKQGFGLIARNWRCRLGEIDLIVQKEGKIRFIEVKTRRGTAFGFPEEAVGYTKRLHFFRAIELWLQIHAPQLSVYQADVVSILWRGSDPEIQWIQNIDLG